MHSQKTSPGPPSRSSSTPQDVLTLSASNGRWQLRGLPVGGLPRRLHQWVRRAFTPLRPQNKRHPIQLEFDWDQSQSIPVSGWRPGQPGRRDNLS